MAVGYNEITIANKSLTKRFARFVEHKNPDCKCFMRILNYAQIIGYELRKDGKIIKRIKFDKIHDL